MQTSRRAEARSAKHRVVIVGGGFGGLYTATRLRRSPVEVTLVDRRNFHLFQPLLYQVATGGLSPGDIASPIRHALKRQRNARVLLEEAIGVDPSRRVLALRTGELPYDTLVIAAGIVNHYFGRETWRPHAPGLKEVEDALQIRRRVLLAFEAAEREPDPRTRKAWLTFVVVGGGPTGVELAGALGELARRTLPGEFRAADPRESRVLLLEGGERVLPSFPAQLSQHANRSLARLGVEVRASAMVRSIDPEGVEIETPDGIERVAARTTLWAAGVRGAPLARALHRATRCPLDDLGRVRVESDFSLPGHPDIFVIGDLAHAQWKGAALPCIAPAAIQEAKYVADVIRARVTGARPPGEFRYFDKGMLATIGRSAAVAEFRGLLFWGFPAWLVWLVIHLVYLIEFQNRLLVLIQWSYMYLLSSRSARLITDGTPD